jgi:glutamate--cysteine ligase
MTPNWTREEMPMMPKGRYRIMTAYMPKVGSKGLDMMYRTCTVQTNLDFCSEADMVKKLRVGLALQPVATALFANSPFTEGKRNGFLSYRSEIMRSMCRCILSSAAAPISMSREDHFAISCTASSTFFRASAPPFPIGRTT